MERLKKIYSKYNTFIYTTFILYTVAILVFGVLALCDVFANVPVNSVWYMLIRTFVLGYFVVMALTGVAAVISFVVLFVMCIRDRDMFTSRVRPRLTHFAIGVVVGLLLEVIFYFLRGYFSPSTPLCCGFLFLYFWPRKKTKKDEDDT